MRQSSAFRHQSDRSSGSIHPLAPSTSKCCADGHHSGRTASSRSRVTAAINAEYGEGPGGIRAGKQDPFFEGGNAWLLRQFPRLDFIRRATLIER
jgi:hypothetical protein